MPIATDEVCELEVEDPAAACTHRATETPVDRGGGELDERTRLDERRKPHWVSVNLRVALRVCDDRLKSSSPKSQHEVLEPQRPAQVGKLEQQQRGVTAEAEPA